MGDIYHAGEVYAGSVPIDDTQASEETVYSSAKVENMMEGVQSELNKGFKYQDPTSDANTFLDGVTIVSDGTNVSNLPDSGQRFAILTFTLLTDPVRKCQIAIGSGLMYYRFASPNWGGWYTLARA